MNHLAEKDVIANGKTKKIYRSLDGHVIVQNKNEITKNDDPSQTQVMSNKAVYATTTTCAVFSLLQAAGIPVAFKRQVAPDQFLAPECKMIPLEVIIRRYAVGSYLKRFPNLEREKGEAPFHFDRLVFEVFLKTTGGKIDTLARWCQIGNDEFEFVDDPLILNHSEIVWDLRHPKIPSSDEKSVLSPKIWQSEVLPNGVKISMIEELARKTFLALEYAWSRFDYHLVDFKIEFGIDKYDNLLVADVIDNDSWRLRTNDWQELSKQNFRDNLSIDEVANKYAIVATLVQKFPSEELVISYMKEKYMLEEMDGMFC